MNILFCEKFDSIYISTLWKIKTKYLIFSLHVKTHLTFFILFIQCAFYFLHTPMPAKSLKKLFVDLLDVSVWKSLFHIAFPSILAGLLQTGFLMTSTYWMGKIWPDANATMTMVGMILFVLIALGTGFSISASILISQYFGAKNRKMVNHVAAQSFLMAGIGAIVLSLIAIVCTPHIIGLFDVEEHIFNQTVPYARISFIGFIFLFLFIMIQSVMRSIGRQWVATTIILIGVVVNFLLNPLFMFGWWGFPEWGIYGSAFVMTLAEMLTVVAGMYLLFSGKYEIHLKWKDFLPDIPLMKRSFFLGLPTSIDITMRSLSYIVLGVFVTFFGTTALAGFGIAENFVQIIILVSVGLSSATSVLVGQSVGADNISRAQHISRYSSVVSFLLLTVIGAVIFLFAPFLMWIFTDDSAVIYAGSQFLRIFSLFFGLIGIQMNFSGVLRAIGKTQIPMYMTIIGEYIIKLPVVYMLMKTSLELDGIWWGHPITTVITACIFFFVMMRVDWSKANLIRDTQEKPTQKVDSIEKEKHIRTQNELLET